MDDPEHLAVAPADEYVRRRDAHLAREARRARDDARVSRGRLLTAAVTVVAAWLALREHLFSAWWLAVPAMAFAALVVVHERVIQARQLALRSARWYERAIARLEDRWAGDGEPGDAFRREGHLYADDLDLFGRGSLFELLCTARTRAGQATLAAWLQEPATPVDVRARQAAVRELSALVDLREDLAVLGADVRAQVDPATVISWARGPRLLPWRWPRVVALLLAASAAGAAAAWFAGVLPAWPLVALLAVNAVLGLVVRPRVVHVLHGASEPARELHILAAVLDRLSRGDYASARLRALAAELARTGAPGPAVARLSRIVELHDWQHNQLFAPVAAALLWGTQCAWAIESWRDRHGAVVAAWLDVVGEFEALAALATYAYEHPLDTFPELVDPVDGTPPVYDAAHLAHPLIPRAQAVGNHVGLGASPQLLLVSGSNMSGKSTLLRAIGINAVLALAGAPVRARSLRLSPVVIGATLRIQDSLQAGRSRFFAEIARVREIVDLARAGRPAMFLFDELFHGTNSHDRVAGAEGVLRSLLDLRTIGLVTTHDLALAVIADRMAPRAQNVHFEDALVGSEVRFDYRLRPGPVMRSNALALMRAVGLDVAES